MSERREHGLGRPAFLAASVGPAALYLFLLFFVPLGIVGAYALLTPGTGRLPATLPVTLDNLRRALDPVYFRVVLRSLRLALLATGVSLAVAFPVAWALREMEGPRRAVVLMAVVLPSWMNLLVKNYAWIVLLRREGVVNNALRALGLVEEPLPLLFNEGAVLVGLVHTYLPFAVLPLFAILERLDSTLLEAARDLGASPWSRFRRIVLPHALPGVAVGFVLVFVPTFGAFVTPDLLGGARGMMVGNLIQNQMLQVRDFPFGSALSVWVMAVSLAVIAVFYRSSRETLGGGAP